jgi:hypothetical protein
MNAWPQDESYASGNDGDDWSREGPDSCLRLASEVVSRSVSTKREVGRVRDEYRKGLISIL